MLTIKEKKHLFFLGLKLDLSAGEWLSCCTTLSSSLYNTCTHAASLVDHEKRDAWLSISMEGCGSVPMIIVLTWQSLGLLELCYNNSR